MSKPTLEEWLLDKADGEPIEAVVIGPFGWSDKPRADEPINKVLPWAEAQPYLRYQFDLGYGAPQHNAITAWTKSWVIALSQYDGATEPFRLPRNPMDHVPKMPGGGG